MYEAEADCGHDITEWKMRENEHNNPMTQNKAVQKYAQGTRLLVPKTLYCTDVPFLFDFMQLVCRSWT